MIAVTDLTPPSAKLVMRTGYNEDWWICYYCENPLCPGGPAFWARRKLSAAAATRRVMAEIAGIVEGPERVQHKCGRCGRIQALGPGVIPFAAGSDTPTALPENMDPQKLATIQLTYDELKERIPRKAPSKSKISDVTGIARSTVQIYWPYVRK